MFSLKNIFIEERWKSRIRYAHLLKRMVCERNAVICSSQLECEWKPSVTRCFSKRDWIAFLNKRLLHVVCFTVYIRKIIITIFISLDNILMSGDIIIVKIQ